MTNNTSKYAIYSLTLAGTLFSGFLSGVKLFTDNCALGETCPLFMGYPAATLVLFYFLHYLYYLIYWYLKIRTSYHLKINTYSFSSWYKILGIMSFKNLYGFL